MSRQVQIRRGSATAHTNFTGAIGEITMDTTNKTLRVHDGETVGGIKLAKQSEIPDLTNIDYVVESQLPTAENNYTWYRKYKSGWVEMGGVIENENQSAGFTTVSLPITMTNSNYYIQTTCKSSYTSSSGSSHAYTMEKSAVVNNITTNTFDVFLQDSSSGSSIYWCVYGI